MKPASRRGRGPARAGLPGAPGPFPSRSPAPLLAAALACAAAACATAPGPSPGPAPAEPPPDDAPPAEAETAPADALPALRGDLEAGRLHAAAVGADSVYFQARGRPGMAGVAADALALEARALERAGDLRAAADRLRELLERYPDRAPDDAPARLARLLVARADDPGAARALLRWGSRSDAAPDLARRAGGGMSVAELEAVLGLREGNGPAPGARSGAGVGGDAPDAAVRAALLAELAVARARAGRSDAAREAASGALEAGAGGEAASRARSVLEGRVAARSGPVRLGVLLPRSGRYSTVGDHLLAGAELAVEHHGGAPPVELSVLDTDAPGTRIEELVGRLEELGATAVLGPVRSGSLARAAGARDDAGLLVLSPSARGAEAGPPALFTLWDREQRALDAARRLGRWIARAVGDAPVGAIFPDDAVGRRSYLEFRRELAAGEAWITAAHGYDPGATTLEAPITAVSAFEPRAVFAPGAEGTSVLQMAPQLSYYGVRAALVAGGPEWTAPATLRRLEPSFTQLRVLGSFVDREAEGSPWSEFRDRYERSRRQSMPANMLPALGHDAALLVLEALDRVHPPRPRALGRAVAALTDVPGATGRLAMDPSSGTAGRRVELGILRDRRLVPATVAEARRWLESSGRLENVRVRSRRRQALQAVRESGIPLNPGGEGDGDGGR